MLLPVLRESRIPIGVSAVTCVSEQQATLGGALQPHQVSKGGENAHTRVSEKGFLGSDEMRRLFARLNRCNMW